VDVNTERYRVIYRFLQSPDYSTNIQKKISKSEVVKMGETQGGMYAVAITLSVLATFFVGLRFHCRRKLKLQLLADDWLIMPALVSTPDTTFQL
jgi:hypothetical protein